MARDFRCAGFPTAADHPPRVGQPGFQDVVINRPNVPAGPLIPDPGGMLCGACAAAKTTDDAGNLNTRRALILSIRNKLTGNQALTALEANFLLRAIFADDSP